MNTGALIGRAEALARGLGFSEPQGARCGWCGRPLAPLGIEFGGRVVWVGSERCGCEGEEAAERREAAARAEGEAKAREAEVAEAGVARRFMGAVVEDPRCAAYLRAFGDRPGRGLYIFGGVGTGKTHHASAVARSFVEAGYRVRLATTIGMLESIQETFGREASSREACREFTRCDVLVLDDLGKESASSWSVMTLFQVVNARYEALLPTVVTSQYGPDGIAARLGRGGERETAEAIASRLRGTSDVVRLSGPDRRASRKTAGGDAVVCLGHLAAGRP